MNNALELAKRKGDDAVWKIANLKYRLPYPSVSYLYDTGLTGVRMPVDTVDGLSRLCDAWRLLIRCGAKPLTISVFEHYRDLLGEDMGYPGHLHDEKSVLRFFARHHGASPFLSAILANHVLVATDVGLLAPPVKACLDDETWLSRHAIEMAPHGLTRERIENGR